MRQPKKSALHRLGEGKLEMAAVTLTAGERTALTQLAREASDVVGRTISRSGVLRALVRYASRQPSGWVVEQLRPAIEEELSVHQWGNAKKQEGKTR